MLALGFFSGIFHAETMPPPLKEEVDSTGGDGLEVDTTRHSWHRMLFQSQVLHKITSYEKTENIQGHKIFWQVIPLLIFMLCLNRTHHK